MPKDLGGGIGWSYSWKRRWGAYVFGVGNSFKGDVHSAANGLISYGGTADTRDWSGTGAGYAVSGGLVYEFFGKDPEGFSMPVFLGPMFSYYTAKNHFRTTDPLTGGLRSDFDVDGQQISAGLMGGVQASWNFWKYFNLNPYAVLTPALFNSTKLNIHINSLTDPHPPTPSQYLPGQTYSPSLKAQKSIGMIGANINYRPWGIGLSVSGLVLSAYSAKFAEGVELTKISLSKSFGNYVK